MPNLFARAPRWIVRSIQRRGLRNTAALATSFVLDYAFDWKYGTETHAETFPDYKSDANTAGFAYYQATKAAPFVAMLESLDLPSDSVFVDVGCGKGKVLLLAGKARRDGHHRFKRLVGLEYDKQLCQEAARNLEIFARKEVLPPVEVINCDATLHKFAGDENVIFLYNSFDASILARFLKTLDDSLTMHPRRLWLIYAAARYPDVVDGSGMFEERTRYVFLGNEFYVYTVGPRGVTGANGAS
jgi:SAM-dependent methyltransferase